MRNENNNNCNIDLSVLMAVINMYGNYLKLLPDVSRTNKKKNHKSQDDFFIEVKVELIIKRIKVL